MLLTMLLVGKNINKNGASILETRVSDQWEVGFGVLWYQQLL